MPTVLRVGPYRFFFYSNDIGEPPHVHVERDDCTAKIWLAPPRLQKCKGFSSQEINHVFRIIEDHQEQLMESWNEYFTG
jgi:hypothetical protein